MWVSHVMGVLPPAYVLPSPLFGPFRLAPHHTTSPIPPTTTIPHHTTPTTTTPHHTHPPTYPPLSMSLAEIELEAGKTSPFPEGFDPLGLSNGKSFKELKKWREAELKHGK